MSTTSWDDLPDAFNFTGPTAPQLKFIYGLMEQLGLDQAEVLEMAQDATGEDVDRIEHLTVSAASEVIQMLKERRDEERRFGR